MGRTRTTDYLIRMRPDRLYISVVKEVDKTRNKRRRRPRRKWIGHVEKVGRRWDKSTEEVKLM